MTSPNPPHLAADLLEQYVMGALDPESVRFVEGHVAQCAPCAALLQQEARVELALHSVAVASAALGSNVVSMAPARRRRVGVVVSAIAAVAAAAVIVVVRSGPSADSPPSLRKCNEPSKADECLAQAQFDGVLTVGPDGKLIVPRYDVGGVP